MNYSAWFRPYYYLPWLTGVTGVEEIAGPAPEIDETAGAFVEYHTYTNGNAAFTQRLTRRVSLLMSYGFQQSNSGSGARNLDGQNGSAAVGINIAQGTGVEARLRVQRGRLLEPGDVPDAKHHRRTQLQSRPVNHAIDEPDVQHRVVGRRLPGHATITASISTSRCYTSWVERGQLSCATTAISASTRRFVLRSRTMGSRLGYEGCSAGNSPFIPRSERSPARLACAPGSNAFDTYYARSGVIWGLSRTLGLGLDYTYYRYRFDGQTLLPPGLVRQADRQQLRAYATVRTALYKGRNRGGR